MVLLQASKTVVCQPNQPCQRWISERPSDTRGKSLFPKVCMLLNFYIFSQVFLFGFFLVQYLAYCLNMTHCLRGGVYLQDQVFGVSCWIVCSSPFSCARILDSNLKETWHVVPFLCLEFNPTEFHRSMLSKSGGGLGNCFLFSVSIPILAISITLWEVFLAKSKLLKMVWILGLFLQKLLIVFVLTKNVNLMILMCSLLLSMTFKS